MKTVIYIGGFELPDKNAAAQRVVNNARILQSLGYDVVLLGISRQRPYDLRLHLANSGAEDIRAWEIGYPAGQREWSDLIQADWPLRQAVEHGIVAPQDVAAVICYNHPAVAQWRVARLTRRWGARAVADCTEWYGVRALTSPANIVKNIDVLIRMRLVNPRMDGLITTAPFMTQHYAHTGLPIVEIPSLIEMPETDQPYVVPASGPTPLLAVASGFGQGAQAASIHDRIDWVLELLDAAAALGADFRLRFVGVDRAKYLAAFPGHAAILDRIGNKIEMLGHLPREQVLELVATSAFAFVMRHESRVTLAGFPTKYSEAITYGTPCIINELPSVRAFHVEGKTGFTIDLSDRINAVQQLVQILATGHKQIMTMKQFCRSSGIFHAGSFEPAVRSFLRNVGVKEAE